MRKLFGCLAVPVAAIALMLLCAVPAQAKKVPKGPGGGAFYEAPSKLPKGHGKAIWRRRAKNAAVELSNAKYTEKLLYTSKSPQGEKIAVSGSFSVPKGKAPKKGWPVITYAHGTTGVINRCAPSRVQAGSKVEPYTTYVYPELEDWLKAGYAVVRTDYPGLGTTSDHPYLIGKSEGRGVLDMIGAARQADSDLGRRFLIAGHSQGGQAALFAAKLAGNWASDLKLRGTVSYAPASHLRLQLDSLPLLTTPSGLSGEAALVLFGSSTANPAIEPEMLLQTEASDLYPQVQKRCLSGLQESNSFGGLAPADLLKPSGYSNADLIDVLDGMNPDVYTPKPIFLAQGTADTTVLPFLTDLLNDELTKTGDKVTYMLYDGVTHGEIVAAAEDDVLAFMEKRLPPG